MEYLFHQASEENRLILSKQKIWPAYIPPFEDEIFSSWLMRICQSHEIKSHSFSKFYFNNYNIWNRDIDMYGSDDLIHEIENNTPLSFQDIKNTFLHSYEDVLYNSNPIGLINRLGIIHRKRKKFSMLFCPGCLSKDNKFYKKSWRLTTSIACTSCGLNLEDRCPNCKYPICFHRLETGYKKSILLHSLDTCFHCKNSICQKFTPAEPIFLNYQRYIDNTISKCYNDKTQYSFTYFQIIALFMTRIYTNSKSWNRIKKAIESEFSNFLPYNLAFNNINCLEQRRFSLYISYLLLESWPDRFIDFYIRYDLNISEFTKDKNLPFWFTDILKKN